MTFSVTKGRVSFPRRGYYSMEAIFKVDQKCCQVVFGVDSMQCSEVLRVHTSAVHCFQVWVQSKELAAVRRTVLGKGLPRYTGNCAPCTGKL